jgi:hypothetical protein
MRNQARIDAKVNYVIEKAKIEESKEPEWFGTGWYWRDYAEAVKRYSSEY